MTHPEDRPPRQPATYEINVRGRLGPDWSDYFGGLSITTNVSVAQVTTTLSGELIDQAALMGVLNNLYGLGFHILTVDCQESDKEVDA